MPLEKVFARPYECTLLEVEVQSPEPMDSDELKLVMRKTIHAELVKYGFVQRSVSKGVEKLTDLANIDGFFPHTYKRHVQIFARDVRPQKTSPPQWFQRFFESPLAINLLPS